MFELPSCSTGEAQTRFRENMHKHHVNHRCAFGHTGGDLPGLHCNTRAGIDVPLNSLDFRGRLPTARLA